MIGPITGILASRNAPVVKEFFTSVLYPFVVDESIGVSVAATQGQMNKIATPVVDDAAAVSISPIFGTLDETIVYRYYDTTEVLVTSITLLSARLNESPTYNMADDMSIPMISLVSGSLVESIIYVNYTNGKIEDLAITHPQIISGTLT